MTWDLFFSHASEDKEGLVLPLTQLLSDVGVSVWLDANELKAGDSLSKSIDKGLIHSSYAVVVLSPAFLSKKWPEYEYRGLLAKEMAAEAKVILPLWHNVTHADILKYSPTLADKFAISSANGTLETLASKIIAIVRPDLHESMHRRAQQAINKANSQLPLTLDQLPEQIRNQIEQLPLKTIRLGPLRNHHFNDSLIQRIRFIRAALLDVYPQTTEFWIEGFQRDLHPEKEIEIWERIASVYLELRDKSEFASSEARGQAFSFLMKLSMGQTAFGDDEGPA